jgi:hypothetical protein
MVEQQCQPFCMAETGCVIVAFHLGEGLGHAGEAELAQKVNWGRRSKRSRRRGVGPGAEARVMVATRSVDSAKFPTLWRPWSEPYLIRTRFSGAH